MLPLLQFFLGITNVLLLLLLLQTPVVPFWSTGVQRVQYCASLWFCVYMGWKKTRHTSTQPQFFFNVILPRLLLLRRNAIFPVHGAIRRVHQTEELYEKDRQHDAERKQGTHTRMTRAMENSNTWHTRNVDIQSIITNIQQFYTRFNDSAQTRSEHSDTTHEE